MLFLMRFRESASVTDLKAPLLVPKEREKEYFGERTRERADGSLLVLEVNRAPGLEGGTIDAYTDAIRQWIAEVN